MALVRNKARLTAVAAVCLCLIGGEASADTPVSVDDLLAMEEFGAASLSPDGRWAVLERRGAFYRAPRYDRFYMSGWATSELWVVDVSRPEAPARLLPAEAPGVVQGPWSPSGRRLAVFRLRADGWRVGVVDIVDRSVRWTDLTPDYPAEGRAVQWRDDDRLVVLTRPDGAFPWPVRRGGESQRRVAAAWERMALGAETSRTVVGAGRFAADTPSGPNNTVWEHDARKGENRRLAAGRFIDLEVSPNGAWTAAIERGEDVPLDPDAPFLMNDTTERRRLTLIEMETARVQRLGEAGDVAPNLLRWSPMTGELLFWSRRDGQAWMEGGLSRIDPESAVLTPVARGDLVPQVDRGFGALMTVHADWLGDTPILFGRSPGSLRDDWFALEGSEVRNLTAPLERPPGRLDGISPDGIDLVADGGIWRLDRAGALRLKSSVPGLRTAVATDVLEPARLRLNDAPRRAWAAAVDPGGRIVRVATATEARTTATSGTARPEKLEVLAVSETASIRRSIDDGVATVWLEVGDEARPIARLNGHLDDVAFSKPQPVVHEDTAGRPRTSWLYLPARPKDGALLPLIVMVYPGMSGTYPLSRSGRLSTGVDPQVLAGAGYAVLSPAMPRTGHAPQLAEDMSREVDSAVDAALAAHPEIDPDRVAVLGHSFGGYAALAIGGVSSRYRSIVALAAPSDLVSIWGEFDAVQRATPEEGLQIRQAAGWAETGQGAMGAPPWAAPEAYVRHSPLFRANHIRAPVLLIHGERDFVPISQAEAVFSALYRQGKDARLVTYWGEGHIFFSPANIRDMYAQIFDWMERTLNSDLTPAGEGEPPKTLPRTQ